MFIYLFIFQILLLIVSMLLIIFNSKNIFFQCIDKARDLLDAELTAMAGESYSRAYGVSLFF